MSEYQCHAPVFEGQNWFVCLLMALSLPFIALAFMLALIIGAIIGIFLPEFLEILLCNYKKILFRIKHCQKGNSDPNIIL